MSTSPVVMRRRTPETVTGDGITRSDKRKSLVLLKKRLSTDSMHSIVSGTSSRRPTDMAAVDVAGARASGSSTTQRAAPLSPSTGASGATTPQTALSPPPLTTDEGGAPHSPRQARPRLPDAPSRLSPPLPRPLLHTATSDTDAPNDPAADTIGTRDLASLATLDEHTILRELTLRYKHDIIYTNVGDILIALNPFKRIDALYSPLVSALYCQDRPLSNVPHVFKIAQMAYTQLVQDHQDQCCVISGESGAGKTETAKFLVEQLLAMCKGKGTLEQKIMDVQPLLEAFGNASTQFNDNSSRFGKYLEVKFGYYGEVMGANLYEYLLEKSRVVRHGDGERNFHIFYYLFSGLSREELGKHALTVLTDYHYLRGGDAGVTRESAIDAGTDNIALKDNYDDLMSSMAEVGFSPAEIAAMVGVLAAVLHIGNVTFAPDASDFAVISSATTVATLSRLLGVPLEDVSFVFQSTTMLMRGELVRTNYNVEQAEENRDAMAKALYGRLFTWIVRRANDLLAPRGHQFEDARGRDGGVTNVGILDIFGFENFVNNSFEQFCINIANEQLQFYFNQFIFASELKTYESEGLDIERISYTDNGPVLNMIFGKPRGLFLLLDEESRFPKATATSLAAKYSISAADSQWGAFVPMDKADAAKQPGRARGTKLSLDLRRARPSVIAVARGPFFGIEHYAGLVVYDAGGFLEKNRDALSLNVAHTLQNTSNAVINALFAAAPADEERERLKSRSEKSVNQLKLSVSSTFKNSLMDLMDKMTISRPYFVRCIKPNQQKRSDLFDAPYVSAQLRYTGVLETTRIRRDGFAVRFAQADFIRRYQTLGLRVYEVPSLGADDDAARDALQKACRKIVKAAGLKGAQVGMTLVFLKYYHHETLLRLMATQHTMATRLTKNVRRRLAALELQRRKVAKTRQLAEAQARREREERQERERIQAEALRLEKEALERAAAAAQARAAEEAAERAKRKREEEVATLSRKAALQMQQQLEEKRQEDARVAAAARLEALRLAEEKLLHEQAEARQKEEAARAAIAAAEAAAAAREQQERDARRRQEEENFLLRQASARKRPESVSSLANDGTVTSSRLPAGTVEELADSGGFAFEAMLGDETLDETDRAALARLQQERQREEAGRKARLKKEHEAAKRAEERERIADLQRIAQRERREREARDAAVLADATASANRVRDLDFGGFSFGGAWGAGTAGAPPPLPPPPISSPLLSPRHSIVDAADKAARRVSTHRPAPPRPDVSAPVTMPPRASSPLPPPPPLPPSPPPTLLVQPVPLSPPSNVPPPLPPPPAMVVTAAPPVPLLPASLGPASDSPKKRPPTVKAKPKREKQAPATPSPAALSPLVSAAPSTGTISRFAGVAMANAATDSPLAAAAPPVPAPAVVVAVSVTAAPAAEAPKVVGEAPRRKLVRGGNAVETKVLPEFTAALQALDDLCAYLDATDVACQGL